MNYIARICGNTSLCHERMLRSVTLAGDARRESKCKKVASEEAKGQLKNEGGVV